MKPILLICLLCLSSCRTELPKTASIGVEDKATRTPYGVKTEQDGVVISPFYPHELMDVYGLPAGKLVKDPYTGLNFLVP